MIARRLFLALGSCAALASLFPGAAIAQDNTPPVVFVHGNGDKNVYGLKSNAYVMANANTRKSK